MAAYQLSPAQVASYHSDGFLLVRAQEHKLVNPTDLQKWANEVHAWPREKGKWMPYDEINEKGESQLMRTECFVEYHTALNELLRGKELISIMGQLADHDMLLFKDKINYKGPNGNGFLAHTDAPAYDHIGKINHITANICIDQANAENGWLEVVRGSQKMEVRFSEGGRIHPDWESSHEWLPIPLEPGDILFFGSHLAHRSGPNRTKTFRSMVYATYHSTADGLDLREKYYAHRRAVFPPEHERTSGQNYEAGWKRYGFAAPFSRQGASHPRSQTERAPVKILS